MGKIYTKQLRATWELYGKSDRQQRMTRNRCTAALCVPHFTPRQTEGETGSKMSKKRGIDGSAGEVEIRDGIKHCETERVNETEKKMRQHRGGNSGRITEKRESDDNQAGLR